MNPSTEISESQLRKLCAGFGMETRIFVVQETGSTNADAAQKLELREDINPFVIFANRQTAGRGRIGRKWVGNSSGNIYASFGFTPRISPEKMANFTLWMGASICQMLTEKFMIPARIKWPNDLFCTGKKLAGILTDVRMDSTRVRSIVFGIGLNVMHVPAEVENLATSLADEVCKINNSRARQKKAEALLDINAVAAELVSATETASKQFFDGRFQETFSKIWQDLDMLAGNPITAIYGNESISGTARGIDPRGSIRIQTGSGEIRSFSAGDVTLKKCPHSPEK